MACAKKLAVEQVTGSRKGGWMVVEIAVEIDPCPAGHSQSCKLAQGPNRTEKNYMGMFKGCWRWLEIPRPGLFGRGRVDCGPRCGIKPRKGLEAHPTTTTNENRLVTGRRG